MALEFTPASLESQAAFLAVIFLVLSAIVAAVNHAYGSFKITAAAGLMIGLWLGMLSAVVLSDALHFLPLKGLPFFFGSIAAVCVGLGLSPVGRRFATTIPLTALVAFQAFRLPLELVLHWWFKQGTIPESMTWTGQNWDILSGIAALACAPLAGRFPVAARVANIIGFALLLNVMRVAIMSSPVSFGWDVQPPLQLAFYLPYALIGPVCVGGALFGHVVLTRALWRKPVDPK